MTLPNKWSVIVVSLIFIAVIVSLLFFFNRDDGDNELASIVMEVEEPIVTPPMTNEFNTKTTEAHLIWEQDQSKLYVQNLQLYYSKDGGLTSEKLYTWEKAYEAEAWVNGEYILIGTQLIEANSAQEGHRGSWITVQPSSVAVISEPKLWHFGPQEILSLNAVDEPNLFFVRYRNGGVHEMVYQSSHGNWQAINNSGPNDSAALQLEVPSNKEISFTFEPLSDLGDHVKAYVYGDDAGSILYMEEPYPVVQRFAGYDMINARLLYSVDDSEVILGYFQSEAGVEFFSLLNEWFSSIIPVDNRLLSGEWIALNSSTFTLISSNQIETLVYNNGYSLTDNKPQYKKVSTDGAKLIKLYGTLVQYEVNGEQKYLSLYDLVHTANADFQSLLMTTLTDVGMTSIDRYTIENVYETHPIFELNSSVVNTNEDLPDELNNAIKAIYEEVDYSYAKTYRKIDDLWYIIVDKTFYQYDNNELIEIGTLPITMTTRTGEGFEGYGVKDFMKMNGKWILSDTEASRIIMLNDKLEVERELAIHLPNQLSVKNEHLYVTTPTWRYEVDQQFNLLDKKKIDYKSSAGSNMVEVDYFRPLQYMTDSESGLTWYYVNGYVHQYHKQKQPYRTFYVGSNVNAHGTERIIPYKDEILVMLDTRLERFDRQGQWLSAINYLRNEPDGIYDSTPDGESSFIIDEAKDVIYLVQGYRIISIDLHTGVVKTIFQQNYSNIGNISRYGNTLYFILHDNYEDRYRPQRAIQEIVYAQYTEVVKVDMTSYEAERLLVNGYIDGMNIATSIDEQLKIELYRYIQ